MSHEKFKSCIDACYACASACDHCASACLGEVDVRPMIKCIQLDRYCADICRLAASFMARVGGFDDEKYARELCGLCARICEDCGAECAMHQVDHCQACAEACRKCAEECRKMAA
ncbi:MAG: four-helix bundle copper-binding protein [Prolixibacteraceae bacterium]